MMIDREAIERENKRLERRLKAASLRQSAIVEDIDHKAPRGLDRALFQRLSSLTVSLVVATLGWFGEATGAPGQTHDEGDGDASSDGGDRVLHVALRSDGQPLADGNLGVGQVS